MSKSYLLTSLFVRLVSPILKLLRNLLAEQESSLPIRTKCKFLKQTIPMYRRENGHIRERLLGVLRVMTNGSEIRDTAIRVLCLRQLVILISTTGNDLFTNQQPLGKDAR
jgi:hypothetical protein